ncbi:hypothetical protein QYM36_007299 [Artemia franciscana]|uniref:Uncharacterized protein n=1 Tax=Artemia franciscana TaxID=6661 RepID=A0AA88HZI0_ARTSF|nr:hypothetical protein QYM36_007299 [Artemia franciscana]
MTKKGLNLLSTIVAEIPKVYIDADLKQIFFVIFQHLWAKLLEGLLVFFELPVQETESEFLVSFGADESLQFVGFVKLEHA